MSNSRGFGRGGMGKGGMSRGVGRGPGGGMGRGQGLGRGRGVGQGQGSGQGPMPPLGSAQYTEPVDPESEAQALRTLKKDMAAQLRDVESRIAAFEGAGTEPPESQAGEPPRKERRAVRRAVVDSERCTGCGWCVDICPEGAIVMAGVAVIAPARCTACGCCVAECPNQAISLSAATAHTAP